MVERLRIRDAPARVVDDGLRQRIRLRGVLMHRLHRRSDLAPPPRPHWWVGGGYAASSAQNAAYAST